MATVVVTGTNKGIGYETALSFARAGHRVYATMRTPAKSPELAAAAAKEQLNIRVITMDVDSDASVRAGFAEIRSTCDAIDILINNAGIERVGTIEESPLDDFKQTMETNYFGVIRCVKEVVTEMRKRRSGTIINISSVAGSFCHPPATAYCASKWALEAFSESLAIEMKPFGVRVAMVKPGIIETAMAQRISAPGESEYHYNERTAAHFTESLKTAPKPDFVAEKIHDIVKSGTWTLRHPVGPDAEWLIGWRKNYSDDGWIDLHSSSNEEFAKKMAAAMGGKA